jgi:transposase
MARPERAIARALGVSNGVVYGYVRQARLAGLSWPLPEGMDDGGLQLLLFPDARGRLANRPATGPRLDVYEEGV